MTGVGGTTLHSANGADSTAWKYGGGGISRNWSQPSYQSGNPHRSYDNGVKCGNPAGFCRQVPDISLDANPNTGYIIECTSIASGCPSGIPWFPVGGTSAGAPLMAAITADANTYSLAHGGQRMGFANPLLYSDPTLFWDITEGSNSINGSGLYKAGSAMTPPPGWARPRPTCWRLPWRRSRPWRPTRTTTNLLVTSPTATKTIKYGKQVTLAGTLTDSGDAPIANRRVYVELREGNTIFWYRDQTDSSGVWSFALHQPAAAQPHLAGDLPRFGHPAGPDGGGHDHPRDPAPGIEGVARQRPPRHVVHLRRQVDAEHARRRGAPAGAAQDQRRMAHDRHRRRQPARRLLAQDPLHHPGCRVPALELRRWRIARLDERHLALPARRHHRRPWR